MNKAIVSLSVVNVSLLPAVYTEWRRVGSQEDIMMTMRRRREMAGAPSTTRLPRTRG